MQVVPTLEGPEAFNGGKADPVPVPDPAPSTDPEPEPEPAPDPNPTPEPQPAPDPNPTPEPDPASEPQPETPVQENYTQSEIQSVRIYRAVQDTSYTSLTSADRKLSVGESLQLTAYIRSKEKVNENELKWISSNPEVISLSNTADGQGTQKISTLRPFIKAGCAGKATVTLITQNNRKASVTFTVAPFGQNKAVDISGAEIPSVSLGVDQSLMLTSADIPSDVKSVKWSVLSQSAEGRRKSKSVQR
jgi:hypothetical protein